jgi:hypothetical protein
LVVVGLDGLEILEQPAELRQRAETRRLSRRVDRVEFTGGEQRGQRLVLAERAKARFRSG